MVLYVKNTNRIKWNKIHYFFFCANRNLKFRRKKWKNLILSNHCFRLRYNIALQCQFLAPKQAQMPNFQNDFCMSIFFTPLKCSNLCNFPYLIICIMICILSVWVIKCIPWIFHFRFPLVWNCVFYSIQENSCFSWRLFYFLWRKRNPFYRNDLFEGRKVKTLLMNVDYLLSVWSFRNTVFFSPINICDFGRIKKEVNNVLNRSVAINAIEF